MTAHLINAAISMAMPLAVIAIAKWSTGRIYRRSAE